MIAMGAGKNTEGENEAKEEKGVNAYRRNVERAEGTWALGRACLDTLVRKSGCDLRRGKEKRGWRRVGGGEFILWRKGGAVGRISITSCPKLRINNSHNSKAANKQQEDLLPAHFTVTHPLPPPKNGAGDR